MFRDSLLIFFFLFSFSCCNVVFEAFIYGIGCSMETRYCSIFELDVIVYHLHFSVYYYDYAMCVRWSQFGVVSVA